MKFATHFLTLIIVIACCSLTAQVAINSDGTSADNSAMLEVKSSNKGFLPPRMTTTERDTIDNPVEGMVIYNYDTKELEAYDGILWRNLDGIFLCGDQIMDIDSNVYNTIRIETLCVMARNLATTRYNNGSAIPLVTDITAWADLTSPGYCWYNNDSASYAATYGALYNWYAVDTGILCPAGWDLPTDEEWKILEGIADTLYGVGDPIWDTDGWRGLNAGKRLKSTGGWDNNGNGTDVFGFAAHPGGYRSDSGHFYNLGENGNWWSATANGSEQAWRRNLYYLNDNAYRDSNYKDHGYSVRCIKD